MKNIFAINKPIGPTSFNIVAGVRRITGVKKVGHAGTLDPLASGVLVIAVGRESTKKINEIVISEKEYIADVRLGLTSTTDDEEGEKTKGSETKEITKAEIEKTLEKFVGHIEQIPPIYSAIKVSGKRAYKIAREGKTVEMKPRQVEIKKIEILKYKYPDLKLNVTTAKGVYIRSLARDIGKELGVGGYLSGLERTRVGDFKISDAISLEQLEKEYKS